MGKYTLLEQAYKSYLNQGKKEEQEKGLTYDTASNGGKYPLLRQAYEVYNSNEKNKKSDGRGLTSNTARPQRTKITPVSESRKTAGPFRYQEERDNAARKIIAEKSLPEIKEKRESFTTDTNIEERAAYDMAYNIKAVQDIVQKNDLKNIYELKEKYKRDGNEEMSNLYDEAYSIKITADSNDRELSALQKLSNQYKNSASVPSSEKDLLQQIDTLPIWDVTRKSQDGSLPFSEAFEAYYPQVQKLADKYGIVLDVSDDKRFNNAIEELKSKVFADQRIYDDLGAITAYKEWETAETERLNKAQEAVRQFDSYKNESFSNFIQTNKDAGKPIVPDFLRPIQDNFYTVLAGVESPSVIYDYMEEPENQLYRYLKEEYGKDKADEYFEALRPILNQRYAKDRTAKTAQHAKDHPLWSNVQSVLQSPLKASGTIATGISAMLGESMDYNDPVFDANLAQRTTRGISAEIIENKTDSEALSFLYQTGMSLVDSVYSRALLGGVGGMASIGASAASDTAWDVLQRGGTSQQAAIAGGLAGVAEAAFEKVPLDNLFDLVSKGAKSAAIKDIVKPVVKQMFTEGGEEALTEITNAIVDGIVMQDLSSYNLEVNSYVAQGMSPDEARSKATETVIKNIASAYLGGMVMGGASASGAVAINTGKNMINGRALQNTDTINALIENGLTANEGSETYDRALALQKKVESGKKTNAAEVGALYQAERAEYARQGLKENPEAISAYYLVMNEEDSKMPVATAQDAPNALQKTSDTIKLQSAQRQAEGQENTQMPKTGMDALLAIDYDKAKRGDYLSEDRKKEATASPAKAVVNDSVQNVGIIGIADKTQGTLRTSNGGTVKADKTAFNSIEEGMVYHTALKLKSNEASDVLIEGYADAKAKGASAGTYLNEWRNFVSAGASGNTFDYAYQTFGNIVSESVARGAWNIGRQQSNISQRQVVKQDTPKKYFKLESKVKLNSNQKAQISILENMAEKRKQRIVVKDTIDGGKTNAYYSLSEDTIVIALDAKSGAYLFWAGHELVHKIKAQSVENYNTIRDFVVMQLEKDASFDLENRIKDIQSLYSESGEKLTRAGAIEEIVANNIAKVFSDETAVQEFARTDKGLLKQVRDYLKDFIDFLKQTLKELEASLPEAKVISEDIESLEKIRRVVYDALNETEGVKTSKSKDLKYAVNSNQTQRYDYSKSFAEQIDDYKNGNFPAYDTLIVGATPEVLQKIGMNALPMTYSTGHLKTILQGNEADHDFGEAILKQLPDAIKKPVAVITSQTQGSTSVVAILEISHQGKQLVAPVVIDGHGQQNGLYIDSNAITSVHSRGNAISNLLNNAIQTEQNGKIGVYYIEKNKASALLKRSGLQLPGHLFQTDGFIHSIRDKGSPVNNKLKNATYSQQFKRWFGKSVVVNEDGTPKILYHQTEKDFTVFDLNRKGAGASDNETPIGIFLKETDKDIGLKGKKQMPLYARIEKPLIVNDRQALVNKAMEMSEKYTDLYNKAKEIDKEYSQKHKDAIKAFNDYIIENSKSENRKTRKELYADPKFNELYDAEDTIVDEWQKENRKNDIKAKEALTKALKANGYDGVILKNDVGSFGRTTEAYIVLDNTQVKSATDNIGTFDRTKPDIRYSINSEIDGAKEGAYNVGGRSEQDANDKERMDRSGTQNTSGYSDGEARKVGRPSSRNEFKGWNNLTRGSRAAIVGKVSDAIQKSQNKNEINELLTYYDSASSAYEEIAERIYTNALIHPMLAENDMAILGKGVGQLVKDVLEISRQDTTSEDLSEKKRSRNDTLRDEVQKVLAKSQLDLTKDADAVSENSNEKHAVLLYNEAAQRVEDIQNKLRALQKEDKNNPDVQMNKRLLEHDLVKWNKVMEQRENDPHMQTVLWRAWGKELDAMLEKYGAIKPGVNPVREVQVPKQTSDNTRTRQTVRTILESSAITDEMVNPIKGELAKGNYAYTPNSDESAQTWAKHFFELHSYEEGMKAWDSVVNGDSQINKNKIALAEYLLQEASKTGNVKDVLKLTAEIAAEGTRAGQAVQALSMLKRLGQESPEIKHMGELYYLQKVVDNINKDFLNRFGNKKGKVPQVKINESIAQELMAATEETYDATRAKLIKNIADQMPSTWIDRWNAWRYLAMLANPRTHIRNLVGNAIFVPAVKIKNIIATGIERAAIKNGTRTKAIKVQGQYKKFAASDYSSVQDTITSGGKMNMQSQIEEEKTVFKKLKWLEKARKTNSAFLEKEDAIFLRHHYISAMGQYLQANKVRLGSLEEGSDLLEKARLYAIKEAQKATYRDFSKAAQMLTKASKAKGLNVLLEGVLPFKKTTVNILRRGVEYSPMGLAWAISKGTYDLRQGKITANEYIDKLASGLSGTAVMGVGMLLVSLGVLRGGFDDEDEEQFARLQGEQKYSVKIGDSTYTIDWMAPVSMPLFIGAELMAAIQQKDDLTFADIGDALLNITEPMFNLSMLQGLNDTLDSISYEENKLTALGVESLSSYLSQAFPSIGGAFARTIDETQRLTYYNDKNKTILPKSAQYFIQKVFSKTPGLSYLLEAKVDVWGENQKEENVLMRAFENFISPGYLEKLESNAVEKEISNLYSATQEKGVLPDKGAKYISVNGEKKDLTAAEYTAFSKIRGQLSYEILDNLIRTSEYEKADDAAKTFMVESAYEYATSFAKTTVSDYEMDGWMKAATELQEKDIPLETFLLYRGLTKGIVSDKDSNGETVPNSKRKKTLEVINSMDLTKAQKDVLYYATGYSEKTIDDAPWH